MEANGTYPVSTFLIQEQSEAKADLWPLAV